MYYAKQSPRGFANEIEIIAFRNKAARDQWVSAHKDDGDVNSAALGAKAITSGEARKLEREGFEIQEAP